MRILVTDGDNRASLAIVRSLGQRGHVVYVAAQRHPALASVSRHCSGRLTCPDPVHEPQAFVATIAHHCRELAIDVLLPVSDITTLLLTEHRTALPEQTRLPFAPAETVAQAADKVALLRLAAAHGVPVPHHVVVHHAKDPAIDTHDLPYPVVIKPGRSRVLTAHGWLSTSVGYADDAAMLRHKLDALPQEAYPVMLQERVVGPGCGVFVCCDQGQTVGLFSHRRLREKPPAGGVSVLRESIEVPPVARMAAERLVQALKWQGVGMVEFKIDSRDGTPMLMEINGRFWGSLQLAIDAGVDFPSLLVDISTGKKVAPMTTYRIGVRSRWWWGDVDALLLLLLRSPKALQLPPGHPGRWRTLLSFLKLWGRDQHYEVLRLNDIKPWLLESRRWLSRRQ